MTAANVSHLPEPEPPRKKKKSATSAAQAAEAGDGYAIIEQCGVELRIGIGEKMPAGVVDIVVDGAGDQHSKWKAVREWVGAEQWQKLKAAGMTQGDVEELDRKLGEASGNS